MNDVREENSQLIRNKFSNRIFREGSGKMAKENKRDWSSK